MAEAASMAGLGDREHCQVLLLSYVIPNTVHQIKYWLSEFL